MADQILDEFGFAVPETGEEFSLLFGGQQVGRESDGGWNSDNNLPRRQTALPSLRLHGRPSQNVSRGGEPAGHNAVEAPWRSLPALNKVEGRKALPSAGLHCSKSLSPVLQ